MPDQRLEDLSVALTGLHPADVWLTRLEAELPQAGLKTDLDVEPAARQDEVDNWLQARLVLNVDTVCPSGAAPVVLGPDGGAQGTGRALLGVLFAAAAALMAVTRRLARPVTHPS
jgi:hypothetical protein